MAAEHAEPSLAGEKWARSLPPPAIFCPRDLAFGLGLTDKVERAYSFLMDFWEPGDRVFLFGFSRGAYTVRVLAGMLHALGLLPRGNHNLVPYVMRLFKSVRKGLLPNPEEHKSRYWDLCDEFRRTFSRQVSIEDKDRRFPVHFVGIWDTVSSVGWVWEPAHFPFTAHNPGIEVIRHAVSIDERRWFFRQNLMTPAEHQNLLEVWFPGVHADVGGGYPEEDGGLWREPFEWMVGQAVEAGLHINEPALNAVLSRTTPSKAPWDDLQHESLKGAWWLLEFFPKWQFQRETRKHALRVGLGRHRFIPEGSLVHRSAMRRVREIAYVPPNFTKSFLDKVRGLEEVPEVMPFVREEALPEDALR
jgi:hypothetical protein